MLAKSSEESALRILLCVTGLESRILRFVMSPVLCQEGGGLPDPTALQLQVAQSPNHNPETAHISPTTRS